MNPFASPPAGFTVAARRSSFGASVGASLTNQTPAPPGPDTTLWLVAIGGVVVLGGLVVVVVLTSPTEAPGARDYHRRRQRYA